MKTQLIWLVRLAAAGFMALLGVVLLIFVAFKFDATILVVAALFIVGGVFSLPRNPNAWRRDPPTQKQLAYAQKLGIDIPHGITKGELSSLITEVTGR